MFQKVSEPSGTVADGAEKRPHNASAGRPRSSARRFVGQPECRVRQPPPEVRIVGEQLELKSWVLSRITPNTALSVALSDSMRALSPSESCRAFLNLMSFATGDGISTVAVRMTRSRSPHSIPPNRSLNSSMIADRRPVSVSPLRPPSPVLTGSISESSMSIFSRMPFDRWGSSGADSYGIRKFRKIERSSQPRLL